MYKQIFEILLRNQGEQVGCYIASDFELDAAVVAGSMIAILEAVLSQLNDCDQIGTEQEILALFAEMVQERHAFVHKETLDDDEYDDN
jgi:hypothetical protein